MAFIKTHIPCTACGSSDAAAMNADGSVFCFSCSTLTPSSDEILVEVVTKKAQHMNVPSTSTVSAIPDRRITIATAEKFGVTQDKSGNVYFPYRDEDNNVVAYKQRSPEKDFTTHGTWKEAEPLFGMSLFNKKSAKSITVVEGECFTPDTEVLTPNGWVSLHQWNGEDVMTGAGVFETPIAKIEKHYEGNLVSYASGSYKSVMTPEHNMVRIKEGRWIKTKAADTATKHLPVPRVVNYVSNESSLMARLQVMMSADFTFRKEGDLYASLKKARKVERAKALLDAAGLRYSSNEVGFGYTSIFVHRGHGLDVSKLFSYERDLKNAATIIDEVVHWDGNRAPNRNQIEYSTKELHNATFIQTCAHLCGYVSTIIRRSNQYGSWYKVSILFGKQTSSTQKGWKQVPYSGRVMCLTVPSGTLLVRYNESISVSGNCDAMAAYQMLGSKWPVVSIKNGAGSAAKDIKAAYEYLDSFETIVICFDNDAPGKEAAKKVCEIFGSKVKVMKLDDGFKDACDYLRERKEAQFVSRYWQAEQYVPDGLINGSALWDEIRKPRQEPDAKWPYEKLDEMLCGLRKRELITVAAGTGSGKSTFLRQLVHHLLVTTNDNIGLAFLEESPSRTALGVMSVDAMKPLHLPTVSYTEAELRTAFNNTMGSGRVTLLNHFGSLNIDNVLAKLRWMAKGQGCSWIFLDHYQMILSGIDMDERKGLDMLLTKLRQFVEESGVGLFGVSHTRRDTSSKGAENGAELTLSSLRGTAGIGQLSDAVIGLQRDQQHDDERVRNTTQVRLLKSRFTGETGPAGFLYFSKDMNRLVEIDDMPLSMDDDEEDIL